MPEYPYPAPGFTPQPSTPRGYVRRTARSRRRQAVRMLPGETLDEAVRRCYPDARTIASAMPELSVATLDPDAVEDARELVDVDLGVVKGAFGVAENGAVWIAQDIRHKALYFGATALVIVIEGCDRGHHARGGRASRGGRFRLQVFHVGAFRRAADIEQALVFGAHGPMSVTVLIRA